MVRKRNYYIITFVCILLPSCASFLEMFDDKLNLQQEQYNGEQLKINGYYFYKTKDNLKVVYFFYNNGILLNAGGLKGNHNDVANYLYREFSNNSKYKNIKSFWGLFQIENEKIKFEKWYPGEVSKTFIREGRILNDTTFKITESYQPSKGRFKTLSKREEIYHFKKFNPKPDSTNKFIQ